MRRLPAPWLLLAAASAAMLAAAPTPAPGKGALSRRTPGKGAPSERTLGKGAPSRRTPGTGAPSGQTPGTGVPPGPKPGASAPPGPASAAVTSVAPSPAAPATGEELPRGRLIERLACAASPAQAYALYLPAAYDPRRAWPIVYALDPRGHGDRAARVFMEGAERFGYVVASSYNSLSDGPLAPTVAAMRAMWNDTHERLRLDDRQVCAAGFSGTVRAAILLALAAPGTFAAVIGAGAGWPEGHVPERATVLPFFGTVGNLDFNYIEMMLLDERLASLGAPHRIEVFDGTHEWPPAGLATEALAWVTLGALRAGTRAADPPLAGALLAPRLAAARALDDGAHPYQAARAYRQLADDFQGLLPAADLDPVARRAAELAALPAAVAAARRHTESVRDEQREAGAAFQTLTGVLAGPPGDAAALARALAELHVAELRRRAQAEGNAEDRLAAQRILNSLFVQTSFYLPRRYDDERDGERVRLALEIAAAIDPGDPGVWYQLAARDAQAGRRRQAVKRLDRAVGAGWTDAGRLAADPAFLALHGDAEFEHLLARLRSRPAASP
jgi:hypothetical protein